MLLNKCQCARRSHNVRASRFCVLAIVIYVVSGCSQLPTGRFVDATELAGRARTLLIEYTTDPSPLLRSHAIEALAEANQSAAAQFVLAGLDDEYWGVRFAACMGVLTMRYEPGKALLVAKLKDPDCSVQAAAAGALHVLGDQRYTSILGRTLFDENVVVRRNTAMVLGRMGDPGAVKILRQAQLHDDDLSVRLQATEAMAVLGDTHARMLMLNYLRSAYDDEVILAMLTLARAKCTDPEIIERIGYVYEQSGDRRRLGMRLVAARALAALGDHRGRRDALKALRYRSGEPDQATRIRKLAAMALAETANRENLACLRAALNDANADVRIAVALAILKCVGASE